MYTYPIWFSDLLGVPLPQSEGARITTQGATLVWANGLLRDEHCADAGQTQTRATFAYKWRREDTYGSSAMQDMSKAWLEARYARLWNHPAWGGPNERPLMLDAGCGAAYSAQILFAGRFDRMRYVGVDVSRASDVAAGRFAQAGIPAAVVQGDLMSLPFADGTFDILFSEGVLHHTPDTRAALAAVARKVRRGGALAFYVYRRKSPVREFTDDYIRDRVSDLPPEQAWELLMPLTKLGAALGSLNVTVQVPENVELLGIPGGPIDVQRLFYWHVWKAFYRSDFSFDEMNHINFDWFTPKYAHRQSEEEVSGWCADLGLIIEEIYTEDAGITVIATRS